MQTVPQAQLAGDIAAALAWWREAGVDQAFADEPNCWLAEPETIEAAPRVAAVQSRSAPSPPAELPRIGGDKSLLPQDLAAFTQWWLTEPTLDHGRTADRVPPRGTTGAAVMVLVEQPEAGDGENLLSGPQGKLLSAMLAAMGIAPDSVYFASILTRHTPMPDWRALLEAGIGEIVAHHVHLVAPHRLIALGGNILPLLGHDPAQSARSLQVFNHEGRTIPMLTAHGLESLMRPGAKKGFWQRWLDWSGVITA